MAVQFKSPTDKIKRITGFRWDEAELLVLATPQAFLWSTEDGDEFINRGRADAGFAVGAEQSVQIDKITYHPDQEAFYAVSIVEQTDSAIIRSDDGGETWQSVYMEPPYVIGRWIAYDAVNDTLRAIVARQGDGFEPDLNGFVNRHLQSSDGLSWSVVGESTTTAAALAFMFAEIITCELIDWLNPSQQISLDARMSQPAIAGEINEPDLQSRLTTVQISRNGGQTWTTVDTGLVGGTTDTGVNCLAAADGGGVLIAVGGGGIAATINGANWSRVLSVDGHILACGFIVDQFLAIEWQASPGNANLWLSVDGFDWESESLADVLINPDETGFAGQSGALSSPFTAQ